MDSLTEKSLLPSQGKQTYYTLGLTSAILFILIFLAWAGLAKIDSATRATGVIISKGNNKTLSNLYGGRIKSIAIQDGDFVQKGQALLTLDRESELSEISGLRHNLDSLVARRDRLSAQLNNDSSIQFSQTISYDQVSHRELIQSERQLFELSNNEVHSSRELFKQKIQKFKLLKEKTEKQISVEESILSSIESELYDKKELLKKGHISKKEYRDQSNLYKKTKSSIDAMVSDVNIYNTELLQNQMALNEYLKSHLLNLSAQLNSTITEIRVLKSQIKSFELRLEHAVVRAPVDGYVLNLAHHTIGGTVKPGERILELRPYQADLVINAKVNTNDINNVKNGMKANFRISAFEGLNAPSFEGYISKVSADRIIDENNNAYFLVELTPKKTESIDQRKFQFATGMNANVLIVNGESTMLSYLLDPVSSVLENSMIEASF